ncbi:MAG: helix-turn-helix domain-containing protein [Magnetospiraceae bacterium]
MGKLKVADIPYCYLYGDPVTDVELNFMHIELIKERSGAHDWTIRAHAHPDHTQILFVESEGGAILIEGKEYLIPTKSIVLIPAAMVHEIHFRPGTDGYVITAALDYVRRVAQGDHRLLEIVATPAVFPLDQTVLNVNAIMDSFHWAYREYASSAPGRRLSIMAQFLRILVALLRLSGEQERLDVAGSDRDYEILCRYRQMLDRNFRTEKSLESYAKELGVSPQRLNQACKARAGKTSSELLHERLIIEAKRYLLYMELTVAEIGYELGFEDPAYFSRFFSQRVGQPPSAYRTNHKGQRQQAAE